MADNYLQSLSEVYAQAIFDLAKENSLLEQVGDDLAGISQCIDSDKDFAEFLATPAIPLNEKAEMLDKLFTGKVESLTTDFIRVLVWRERLEAIRHISDQYNVLMDRRVGRVYGTITTAIEISDQDFETLSSTICEHLGMKVILDRKVDPVLIGGVTLRIGNSVLDGSVRNSLSKIAETIRSQKLPDISLIIDDAE